VLAGIFDKAQLLGEFPELGHKYRSEPEGDPFLLAKPGQVTIRMGKPIETKDFSAGQKHELAAMIQL
jgi:hypothetical protein